MIGNLHKSVVAASVLLLILYCHPSAMLTSGSLEGKVVEKEGGLPLAYCNVVITATGMGRMTREDGSFRIDGIHPGSCTVRAMMIGYETDEICTIEIEDGSNVRISCELEPMRRLGSKAFPTVSLLFWTAASTNQQTARSLSYAPSV